MMKIAFISYEFPPDTGFGGIGTYTYQAAHAMAERGHYIEVFSCSHEKETLNISINDSIKVHRVKAPKRSVFSQLICGVFRERNDLIHFDLIESPEYCAEGIVIRENFPGIPFIVKLHTPLYLVNRLNNYFSRQPLKKRIKQWLGRNNYQKLTDKDYQLAISADAVCSPSASLAGIMQKEWGLPKVDVIPNVFKPGQAYLELPVSADDCRVVTYVGRLDVRKGVLSLADAIPIVLKHHPSVRFRFIGGDGIAPANGGSMKDYITSRLQQYKEQLEFTGYITQDAIPRYLTDTGIVVFPSIWENYPCVCLEAMSGAKAIVASKNGGMAEMLADMNGGILIDPLKPKEIAKAICRLIEEPAMRVEMGTNNRQKMRRYTEAMALLAETYYLRVMNTTKQETIKTGAGAN